MSQKPDEHCQKEYYVDHENADSTGEAPVRTYEYAGIHGGVIRPSKLV